MDYNHPKLGSGLWGIKHYVRGTAPRIGTDIIKSQAEK